MKKVVLSVAAIATSFLAMSFAPVEKNANLSEAELDLVTVEIAAPGCSTKYKTEEDFSECQNTHTPVKEIEAQHSILNKY